VLQAAEDGPVQLWAALHPLKADAAAAAPEAIAAAAASDLEVSVLQMKRVAVHQRSPGFHAQGCQAGCPSTRKLGQ